MTPLPPYADFLGLSARGIRLTMPGGDTVMGRPDYLHGGALAGLLEVAAIVALRARLDEGDGRDVRIKPINVTVDFLRGGQLIDTQAEGRITKIGRRVASVEAFAWQTDRDRPVAGARTNYLLVRDGE